MRNHAVGAILGRIAVALVCLAACGDDGAATANGASDPDTATEPTDAAVALDPADAAPPVAYPESKKALEQLIGDLVAAVEAGDRGQATRLVESFELMDYQGWFAEHFGDELGARLAASYEPAVGRFDQLLGILEELVEKGHDEIGIERFTTVRDKDAVLLQNLALGAQKKRGALYSVRLVNPKADADEPSRVFHLWSFIHHDGSFRWVGKLKEVAPEDEDAVDDDGRDRRELRMRELEVIDKLAAP